jgi:hypothetical protein
MAATSSTTAASASASSANNEVAIPAPSPCMVIGTAIADVHGNIGSGKMVEGLDRESFTRDVPIVALRVATTRVSALLKLFHGQLITLPKTRTVVDDITMPIANATTTTATETKAAAPVAVASPSTDSKGPSSADSTKQSKKQRQKENSNGNGKGDKKAATSTSSTKLLLLRETIGSELKELPANLQQVIRDEELEIVAYSIRVDYTSLGHEEVLRAILPSSITVPSAYETVGHIAHLNLRDDQMPYKYIIGQVLIDVCAYRMHETA